MAQSIRDINWNEFEDALPAFLIFVGIPLTSSIANGIAIGFLVYPVLKIVKGKGWKYIRYYTYLQFYLDVIYSYNILGEGLLMRGSFLCIIR